MQVEYSQVKILTDFKMCIVVFLVGREEHLIPFKSRSIIGKDIKASLYVTASKQYKIKKEPYKVFRIFVNLTGGFTEFSSLINEADCNACVIDDLQLMGISCKTTGHFIDQFDLAKSNPYYYYDNTVAFGPCMALFKFLGLPTETKKKLYSDLVHLIPKACKPTLFMTKTKLIDANTMVVFNYPPSSIDVTYSYNIVDTFVTFSELDLQSAFTTSVFDTSVAIFLDNFYYYSSMDFIEDKTYQFTYRNFKALELNYDLILTRSSNLIILPAPTLALIKNMSKRLPDTSKHSLIKSNPINGNIDIISSSDDDDEKNFKIDAASSVTLTGENYGKRYFAVKDFEKEIGYDSNAESISLREPSRFQQISDYLRKYNNGVEAASLSYVFDMSIEQIEFLGSYTDAWILVGSKFHLNDGKIYL